MSSPQASRIVTVVNRQGLHARCAMDLAKLARTFRSRIVVIKGDRRADATSVMELLTLGADHGEQLWLEATGDDAEAALAAVSDLFARGFGEEEEMD